jgi:alpha-glucosidase (family GH31 glycosyl hydrolase)
MVLRMDYYFLIVMQWVCEFSILSLNNFYNNEILTDYTLLPWPGISFKTVGGILDFFLFVGHNPEHVIQLYTSLIGRPYMPAFWSLGFHLCKYGYHNTTHVEETIYRQVKEKIPYVMNKLKQVNND